MFPKIGFAAVKDYLWLIRFDGSHACLINCCCRASDRNSLNVLLSDDIGITFRQECFSRSHLSS